jgi:subtilisin-like proprotein convertase family protein
LIFNKGLSLTADVPMFRVHGVLLSLLITLAENFGMVRIFTCVFLLSLLAVSGTAQTFNGGGGPIPDDGNMASFEIPVSGLPNQINSDNFGLMSVCVRLTHTWNADLWLSLRAPDGKVMTLFAGVGGDTDGFDNTCLSGNETVSIYQGSFPYTGSFRPFDDMGELNDGQNPNGNWTLEILDTYAFADEGTLFDWNITFGDQPCKPYKIDSTDLPIIRIYTGGQLIQNEPKTEATMRVLDNGPGQTNYPEQANAAYEGPVGIEIHGNSTQGFPKKSYDLELRDSAGNDLEIPLLGLPDASDYVLGANFSDKTLMRNALTYKLARSIDEYAPRTRFCHVYVDANYRGVYALTEKIRRGKDKVDIPKLTVTDTAGVELTGGYIVKIDWSNSPGWNSQFSQPNSPDNYTYFQHVYPRADEILPQQATYIRDYIDSFEVALHGDDFQDAQLGWRHFADEKAMMDYLFINEMSRNIDGYRLSTYFYKQRDDKGGKLHMGPVWDYDLAWYNADYCDGFLTTGWAYNINYVCEGGGVPFWWEKLMLDTVFTQNMACRWQTLRNAQLSRTQIFHLIDSMATVLERGQTENFHYWPILGAYIWPNPGDLPTTYAGEITKLKSWISGRLVWLDAAFNAYDTAVPVDFSSQQTGDLQWLFSPGTSGDYTYSWDFGDGASSTDATPTHQYAGYGNYLVTLSISSPFGCSYSATKSLIVSATHQYESLGQMQVSPNPARDRLLIRLPEVLSADAELRLTDVMGRVVLENVMPAGKQQMELGLAGKAPGVYALRLRAGGKEFSAKVIVENK